MQVNNFTKQILAKRFILEVFSKFQKLRDYKAQIKLFRAKGEILR